MRKFVNMTAFLGVSVNNTFRHFLVFDYYYAFGVNSVKTGRLNGLQPRAHGFVLLPERGQELNK